MTEPRKELTIDQAVAIVDQVVINYHGTRAEHDLLKEAMGLIKQTCRYWQDTRESEKISLH